MRFRLMLCLVLCLSARLVSAGPLQKVCDASVIGHMTLSGVDGMQTMYLIAAKRGTEANLAFAPFVHAPVKAGALKMGLAAGSSLIFLHFKDEHPTMVLIASSLSNSFLGWVVYHNSTIP